MEQKRLAKGYLWPLFCQSLPYICYPGVTDESIFITVRWINLQNCFFWETCLMFFVIIVFSLCINIMKWMPKHRHNSYINVENGTLSCCARSWCRTRASCCSTSSQPVKRVWLLLQLFILSAWVLDEYIFPSWLVPAGFLLILVCFACAVACFQQ